MDSARSIWRGAVVGAALTIAVGQAAAAQTSQQPPIDPMAQLPGNVRMHGDLVYAVKPGFRPLTLDLYVPSAPGPHPLVVFVHGGGWAGGSKRGNEAGAREWPLVLADFVARGFAVASVSYRFSGEAKFPAQVQDINDALRWLKANSAQWGVDPNRVGLWGASAGAQIASLVVLDCQKHTLDPKPTPAAPSTCVSAYVDWYGPSDFTTIKAEGSTAVPWGQSGGLDVTYLGCATAPCPEETLKRASPLYYAAAGAPPTLFVHGDADNVVPLKQTQDLKAAFDRSGAKTEIRVVPGANHLFRGATPAEIDKAFAATFGFFEQNLKNKP